MTKQIDDEKLNAFLASCAGCKTTEVVATLLAIAGKLSHYEDIPRHGFIEAAEIAFDTTGDPPLDCRTLN